MGERQRLFLPFGEGLERSTGVMVTEPTKFEDLRNVFLFEGKAQARKGYARSTIIIDDASANMEICCALGPVRAEAAAMGCGYNSGNREVHVNLMSISGTGATHIASALPSGELFVLATGATFEPPVIHMADTYNRNFMAHDEPVLSYRAQTAYYDPNAWPLIQYLTADLDNLGDNPVYFRGVTRHLSYLVGWGFGSDSEPDRPDVVRVSLAGDPLEWDPRHWFYAGQRSEPVMVCRPAGNILLVFKETETHEIFGYSPETFGIRPADALHGCVGSRLAVSVAGTCFFWSVQGPRMSQGGESADLAVPLDLDGPDPATLVAESDPEEAFADYDAVNRIVLFVWGRRVYALSIRNPARPRWSYYELPASAVPFCGAQFFATTATGGGGTSPTGWPRVGGSDAVSGPAAPVLGNTTIDLEWYNNLANGTEVVEIHLKDVDGTGKWGKIAQPAVDLSAGGPNYLQTFQIAGLDALHEYEVALRYKAGGTFSPGMTSGDPATWNDPACPACAEDPPSYIPALYTTASAPVLVDDYGTRSNNGLWERTSASAEQITIDIGIPAGHTGLVMEVQRERHSVGNTATQNINGMGPGDSADQLTQARLTIEAALAAGSTQFVDPTPTGEELHDYWVRFLSPGGAPDSPWSINLHSCHAGPDAPQSLSPDCSIGGLQVRMTWNNAATPTTARTCPPTPPSNHSTQGWYKNQTQAPGGPWNLSFTRGPGYTTQIILPTIPAAGAPGDSIRIAGRHKTTCSGVVDYSRWILPGWDDCNIQV